MVENVWLGVDGLLRCGIGPAEKRARASEVLSELLGTAPDAKIAVRLNRPLKGIQGRRLKLKRPAFGVKAPRFWDAREDSLLGTMPDKRLARKIQRPVNSVRLRRLRRGIRAFNPSRHFWTREDDRLLGIRPDDQVALLIGATVKAVRRRRHERKIPRCAQQPRQRAERKAGGKFGKIVITPR